MTNFIKYADLNIQNGLLNGRMKFLPGLNILSGENGTLKTKTLQSLKEQDVIFENSNECRRQAISPKRNAQRQAFLQMVAESRQQNIKLEALLNERNINDSNFENYPNVGQLFYHVYNDLASEGGNQREYMEATANQFNSVIERIFPRYKLITDWNQDEGIPRIEIQKNENAPLPLEGLSLGEQEVLSLATYLYSSRDRFEVFLIDEPEVHLNWHLEVNLFDYLDYFCREFERQLVVVTHSRVVFTQKYFPMTQFLYWTNSGTVLFDSDVTPEQRRRIAGDAIEIIKLGTFNKPTFFVEDSAQEQVVEELGAMFGNKILVSKCGNKQNVRSLYRLSLSEGGWSNSYFMEDGDNENTPSFAGDNFIHLDHYSIENYLLDFTQASRTFGCTKPELRSAICDAVKLKKDTILKKNRFFEFLIDNLRPTDITPERLKKLDCSEILPVVLKRFKKQKATYVRMYLKELKKNRQLNRVLPKELIKALQFPNS